ncbi:MAG: geranylgeranyl reductase family protein [Acidimicrobiales bacterium]
MTGPLPTDVVDLGVVGGGPAGSAAAITAARAGRRVVLVDKARFPRDKCCGDGLTTGALRHLEALGLDPGAVRSWQPIDDVVLRSPSGRTVTVSLPRGQGRYAAVAGRVDLDAALLDRARAVGVEVHEGAACTGVTPGPDQVGLTVDGGRELRARYVVAADGMWSPVRKAVGAAVPGYRGEWHAFRQYVRATTPASRRLWVWFEPDLLPGYAWSFPLPGGVVNVGFGIQRRGGGVGPDDRVQDMAATWRHLLARPHVAAVLGADATVEGNHRAWPIPARVTGLALTAGRVLFVGDAAAATDPATGEGIGQALLTGALAARALGDGPVPADAAAVTDRYEADVLAALAADHRMSAVLTTILGHRAGAATAIRLAGLTPWTRRNFARWLFEDYPRALALTPRRWHRRMFTGPGAYRDDFAA